MPFNYISRLVKDAQPTGLVYSADDAGTDKDLLENIQREFPNIKLIVMPTGSDANVDLPATYQMTQDRPAMIIYTSGTTGRLGRIWMGVSRY